MSHKCVLQDEFIWDATGNHGIVVQGTVIEAWVFDEHMTVCPVHFNETQTARTKSPKHWMAIESFDQLNSIEAGLGAKVTLLIKEMFASACANAKRRAELDQINKQHQDLLVVEQFTAWLKEAGAICLESNEVIVAAFNQSGNFMLTPEVGFALLRQLRMNQVLNDLSFAVHRQFAATWLAKHGINRSLELIELAQLIIDEAGNKRLSASKMVAAYKEEKKILCLEITAREREAKTAQRSIDYALCLKSAEHHDDGTRNSHELAEKIMAMVPGITNFRMLVAAILEVRANKIMEEPFHRHTPLALREKFKPAGLKGRGTNHKKHKKNERGKKK